MGSPHTAFSNVMKIALWLYRLSDEGATSLVGAGGECTWE